MVRMYSPSSSYKGSVKVNMAPDDSRRLAMAQYSGEARLIARDIHNEQRKDNVNGKYKR